MESMSWSFWSPARGSSPEDRKPQPKRKESELGKSQHPHLIISLPSLTVRMWQTVQANECSCGLGWKQGTVSLTRIMKLEGD